MDRLKDLFDLAGSLICHQLPSRSLYAEGLQLPVCARDMGIYTGIFTAAIFILLFGRLDAQRPPRVRHTVMFCLMMLPMIFDGVLSYLGAMETNNTARIFTGVLFGLPIPYFLTPVAHYDVEGGNEKPVLRSLAEFLPALVSGLLLGVLLLKGAVPYIPAAIIYVSGLFFILARLAYTVFARMRRFSGRKLLAFTFMGTISVLTILYLLSTLIFQPLKEVFLYR